MFGTKIADFFMFIAGTKALEDSLLGMYYGFQKIAVEPNCEDGVVLVAGSFAYLATYVAIQYMVTQHGIIVPVLPDVASRVAQEVVEVTLVFFDLHTNACDVIYNRRGDLVTGCYSY